MNSCCDVYQTISWMLGVSHFFPFYSLSRSVSFFVILTKRLIIEEEEVQEWTHDRAHLKFVRREILGYLCKKYLVYIKLQQVLFTSQTLGWLSRISKMIFFY